MSKTSLNKATAYRLLSSLVTGGMLERRGKNSYVAASHRITRTKYRIGYAAQSEEFAFSRLVSDSIRSSAYEVGCELLVLDNRYSATVAMRNADQFMREHVDLVIEFQTNYETAHTIGSRLVDASIPDCDRSPSPRRNLLRRKQLPRRTNCGTRIGTGLRGPVARRFR